MSKMKSNYLPTNILLSENEVVGTLGPSFTNRLTLTSPMLPKQTDPITERYKNTFSAK
jgi:hypothetical protein